MNMFDYTEKVAILETSLILKWFIGELAACPVAEYDVNELVSEAIQVLGSQSNMSANLGFITERLYEHYLYKTNCAASAKIISINWMSFVGLLMDVYLKNNLWDEYGKCNYYFKRLAGYDIMIAVYNPDANAIMLQPPFIPCEGQAHDSIHRTGVLV